MISKMKGFFLKYMDELKMLRESTLQEICEGLYKSLPFVEYKEEWEMNKIERQFVVVTDEMISNSREIQFIKFINLQEKTIRHSIDTLICT